MAVYFDKKEFRREWQSHADLQRQADERLNLITERFIIPAVSGYLAYARKKLSWANDAQLDRMKQEASRLAARYINKLFENGEDNSHAYISRIAENVTKAEFKKYSESLKRSLSMDQESEFTEQCLHDTMPDTRVANPISRIGLDEIRAKSPMHAKAVDLLLFAPEGKGAAFLVCNIKPDIDLKQAHALCAEIAEALRG